MNISQWALVLLGVQLVVVLLSVAFSYPFIASAFSYRRAIEKGRRGIASAPSTRFCVLIPARDEGKNVSRLLESLSRQSYPKDLYEVYLIVEDKDDLAIKLALDHGFGYLIRDVVNPGFVPTKGGALDEAIKALRPWESYEAVVVFDADDWVTDNFLAEMDRLYKEGKAVGVGRRIYPNRGTDVLAGCGALISMGQANIMAFGLIPYGQTVVTGTGYFVRSSLLERFRGYPWQGLTEDMMLTNYCHAVGIPMGLSLDALVFDKQTTSLRMAHRQHVRWIWGYMAAKGLKSHVRMRPFAWWADRIGVGPFVVAVVVGLAVFLSLLLAMTFGLIMGVGNPALLVSLPICSFMVIYLMFMGLAVLEFHCEPDNDVDFGMKLIQVIAFPLCFADLVVAFFHGLLVPRLRKTWTRIER